MYNVYRPARGVDTSQRGTVDADQHAARLMERRIRRGPECVGSVDHRDNLGLMYDSNRSRLRCVKPDTNRKKCLCGNEPDNAYVVARQWQQLSGTAMHGGSAPPRQGMKILSDYFFCRKLIR